MVVRAVAIQSEMEAVAGFDPGELIMRYHAEYYAMIRLCKYYPQRED